MIYLTSTEWHRFQVFLTDLAGTINYPSMAILQPSHVCAWTRRQRTHVKLAGNELQCAGGTGEAVLEGVRELDVVLFVEQLDFDEVEAFVVEQSRLNGLSWTPAERLTAPFSAPDAPHARLADHDRERIAKVASAYLFAHDDCMLTLRSDDPAILRGALRGLLRLHESYFRRDLEWGAVLDTLYQEAQGPEGIEMRSEPRKETFRLLEPRPGVFGIPQEIVSWRVWDGRTF